MKKAESNKKAEILRTWNEYEFRLYVPKTINKDNKIEVHFNFINPATGKGKQIKKATGIDRYAKPSVYTSQAKQLVEALITILGNGWNPINNTYPDHAKLNKESTISNCITVWLKHRQSDLNVRKIKKNELRITTTVFNFYREYLEANNLQNVKPEIFTQNDINQFMRKIEKDRKFGKPTYNAYLYRLSFFFEFLIIERVITFNPCKGAHRYSTKNLDTRYTIYEEDELDNVKKILATDLRYKDLLIATHLLYTYRIRGLEQLRIQIKYFNFETSMLTLPVEIIEDELLVSATKNGSGATFKISDRVMNLIEDYLGDNINKPDYYLFGGHNKAGIKQKSEVFFSQKWIKFREHHDLPKHLKFYALKHTSNYNSYEDLGLEALSKINRHADVKQTQDYIKSKLKKEVIIVSDKNEF